MRRGMVLAAGGGVVLAVATIAFGAGQWLSGPSKAAMANAAAKSDAELTTGAIAGRWPGNEPDKTSAPAAAPAVQPATTRTSQPAPVAAPACANPNAMGVSRTVEIDTTGGPGLGMSQYRDYDFLQPGEVVLTFDDGPWPVNTPAVLAAGHTVGSHTWSHVNLAIKPLQEAKDEIEKGFSAATIAAGQPVSPFFRFPQLRQTAELKAYLGERNIAAFSIDVDSEDFRIHKPEALVTSVMTKLKKAGKGILLMHDFQKSTAQALPEILRQMKDGGYKVVFIKAKDPVVTLPEYDAVVATAMQPAKTSNAKPLAGVIRTVSGN